MSIYWGQVSYEPVANFWLLSYGWASFHITPSPFHSCSISGLIGYRILAGDQDILTSLCKLMQIMRNMASLKSLNNWLPGSNLFRQGHPTGRCVSGCWKWKSSTSLESLKPKRAYFILATTLFMNSAWHRFMQKQWHPILLGSAIFPGTLS